VHAFVLMVYGVSVLTNGVQVNEYVWADTLQSHVCDVFDMDTGLAFTIVAKSPGAHSLAQVFRIYGKKSLSNTGFCKMVNEGGQQIRVRAFLHCDEAPIKTETAKSVKVKSVKTEA
jgi:hypothetical protein